MSRRKKVRPPAERPKTKPAAGVSESSACAIPDPDYDAKNRGRAVLTTGGKGTGQVRKVTASRRR